ncbi:DsbE family thiol:disulfide interchange protein [Marinobacter halophilus]|uniref:DsbE family thiol:disulfide interchange protein n=1 Tax=Marinobacter halophilus TaxID=1323740 RepID=A0A2T1K9C8_9GAMM|nr:DsbE family thiol:disulfide interchange protein [Marinobacter halophilus]PSF06736.1 DsbE family thiol:disulfide interchange protein [Marinobacter halophilus]GGC75075.1 thiol:disulfide interchange protein DsbE [Marinobacter halophilus]
MKRLTLFLPLVLALAVGLFLAAGIGKDPTELESALIGKPVPEFSLENLREPDQTLDQSLFHGQVSLLNVWAEWCPACWDEHEDLMWLANEKGVRIIGLNYKDQRENAFRFLGRLGDPYQTIIFDPRGSLGFDLGVYGAPETFVIDAEGIVRYRHVGVVNERVWEEILLPVINRAEGNS